VFIPPGVKFHGATEWLFSFRCFQVSLSGAGLLGGFFVLYGRGLVFYFGSMALFSPGFLVLCLLCGGGPITLFC
jgi:hypothetical protein